MNGFIIAPAALGDLDEIWDYYATQLLNPDVADRVRDEIFEAFHTLAKTPGLGHFRMDLAKDSVDTTGRAVDVQVTRLRRKIEPDPREPRYLQTVRGEGYVLRPDP